MSHGKFATAINCIDGRCQVPVSAWMKEHFGIDYVDRITEPGPDKVLSGGSAENIESIKRKVMVSVNAHKSRVIAIAAHHDCAGNPVSMEDHWEQLRKCVVIVKSWKLPVKVVGLWVNEEWNVEVVDA
ncbi:MAG: hypothetical protein HYW26_01520 [Candidatus Aenigmarchaeota archaeon]|nr:hypothetical protein [Candidatus Aenigmarchaeota archaeon]